MKEKTVQIEISDEIINKWQNIVDTLSELMDIPAALIMRIAQPDIEVFVASQSKNNPYQTGDHEQLLGSGLYCETVIKTNDKLLIPNALNDENWKNNPDVKLNMISYLGFPITLPDGSPFGTICILDNKENVYSKSYENLLKNFRDIVQSELGLIYMNEVLGEENKNLSDYLAEIKTLRGILPICASCKKVRDDKGYWKQIESYLRQHTDVSFTHGYCPDCMDKMYSGQKWYERGKQKGKF